MATAVGIIPQGTTGKIGFWNGTKDGKEGRSDFLTRTTNCNPPLEVTFTAQDIRHLEPRPALLKNGYELVSHPTNVTAEELLAGKDEEGKQRIRDVYLEECRQLVEKMTGAPLVIPTTFKVRQEDKNMKDYLKKLSDENPRPLAHVDRDTTNAAMALEYAVGPERTGEIQKKYKHRAQINVWRPIRAPASRWPLLFINHDKIPDWSYAEHTGRLFIDNDPREADRGGKSYEVFVKHDSRYVYHYVQDLKPDEAVVFASFNTEDKMTVPHGAFWDDNTAADAPPRKSIEARTLVFFND